jgi:hypothetical protein
MTGIPMAQLIIMKAETFREKGKYSGKCINIGICRYIIIMLCDPIICSNLEFLNNQLRPGLIDWRSGEQKAWIA